METGATDSVYRTVGTGSSLPSAAAAESTDEVRVAWRTAVTQSATVLLQLTNFTQ